MFDARQKIDHFARMLLPGICTLLLLILSLLQIGLAGLARFPIEVCLIAIYYWTVFRPTAMPFWFVFVLGVIRDSLMGGALGISSLTYLLFRLIVLTQQRMRMNDTFWATWLGFGMVMVPALTFHWLLASAFARQLLPVGDLLMQWIFTFGFYPLLHILFNALYSFLPGLQSRKKKQKQLL